MLSHWLDLRNDSYRSLGMKDGRILLLKFILLVRIIKLKFLSNFVVCFIGNKVLERVTNETVIKIFQDMCERRVHL